MLLTNADLDHVLGLLSMREGGRLQIYATEAVRGVLTGGAGLRAILDSFCGVDWHEPPVELTALHGIDGVAGDVEFRAIPLPGNAPLYAGGQSQPGVHSVAYQFMDRKTGARLLVAPDVAACNDDLKKVLLESNAVLFDGTFWSDGELSSLKPNARTATQMGHLTIRDASLGLLSGLPAARKVYIHINNTNPILAPGSPERVAVDKAGITVGQDGMEFDL